MTADLQSTSNVAELLRGVRTRLKDAGISDPMLDAKLLVEAVTGLTATDVALRRERTVSAEHRDRIIEMVSRRLTGEPVHRIIGKRGFHQLDLHLSAETLEPRPDTETLVELALPLVRETVRRASRCDVLDLGTGSGAIALSLLHEIADARAVGTDISADALETARRNAAAHGLGDRFDTVKSDWYSNVEGRFHIIVSNPPYIRTDDLALLQPEVRRFDPVAALDGGHDGLDAYRAIAEGAHRFLIAGGHIAVENGYDQMQDVIAIFARNGYRQIGSAKDLAGHQRAQLFAG